LSQTVASIAPIETQEAVPKASARLWWVSIAHCVVDFFSYIIIPLVTVLQASAHFTEKDDAILLGLGSISSGLIQPLVALWSDKHDTRWLGTAGAAVAAVAMCLIGYVDNLWMLLLLQGIGSAGVGAFHPVAAAAVGHLSGARRARGVAMFYSAGMLGAIGAGFIMPQYATHLGLRPVAWLIIPGLLVCIGLAWAVHGVPHKHAGAHHEHAALPLAVRRRRWVDIGLLYASNVVRFMVNMMLVQLLIRWSEARALSDHAATALTPEIRHDASEINGPLQAAMSIGMLIAGVCVGLFVKPRMEKPLLITMPMLGALSIAAFPWATADSPGTGIPFALCILAGIGYAGVVPITISMAQRLLPHRTSLASGLMMGGAWSIAALGPALAQQLYLRAGLSQSFMAVGGLLLVAVVLGALVRHPDSPASNTPTTG